MLVLCHCSLLLMVAALLSQIAKGWQGAGVTIQHAWQKMPGVQLRTVCSSADGCSSHSLLLHLRLCKQQQQTSVTPLQQDVLQHNAVIVQCGVSALQVVLQNLYRSMKPGLCSLDHKSSLGILGPAQCKHSIPLQQSCQKRLPPSAPAGISLWELCSV